MKPRYLLFAATLIGSTLNAAVLPLKPGNYVLTNVLCHDPAFAATFSYDGHQFSYPHATACRSIILSHAGRSYKVRETCSAAGDGSATTPSRIITKYKVLSATRVSIIGRTGRADFAYRWCPAE